MSRKRVLSLGLVLAILLCTVAAPLVQPSVAFGAAPDQPVNQSPSGASENLTPTLVASPFSDNDTGDYFLESHWQIWLGSDDNYSDPVRDYASGNVTSIEIPFVDRLDYSTTYSWHVAYKDNESVWSEWSDKTSFTTMANQPPERPSSVSPAGPGITLTPTLQSSAFSDDIWDTHAASRWQIRTSTGDNTTPVFESGADGANLESIEIPSGVLSYDATYYWHVSYRDNNGLWSENSTDTSFSTVANEPPDQPIAVSPTGLEISVTPTLISSAFSDDPGDTHYASEWQVRVATADNWNNPVFYSGTDNVNLTAIIIPSGELSYSTLYLWRVRHQDNYGAWSDYSEPTWFQTSANRVPDQPDNSLPVDGGIDQSLTLVLASSAFSDPDAGDTHGASQWQIATASGDYTNPVFDSGIDTVNLTSIMVPSGRLSYSTTYYWHVRHQDNSGAWSEYSAETLFTTLANHAPGVPTNSLPANLATGVSLTPTLQSSAFSDDIWDTHAASQWQITTVATNWEASLVWDNEVYTPDLTSTVVPSGLLSYSATYYWRVRHQDSHEAWSAWSAPTSFTTRPPGTGADFAANITVVIAGQPVQFTDTSTGAIVSWTWNFGDGTATVTWSSVNRPTDGKVSHTYAAAGAYTVALTVTDGADESYTETKPAYINVFVLPAADFSVSATAVVLGEAVAFTSLSSGGIPPLTYAWDFDDDGVIDSTSKNPSYSYGRIGTYTVSLKVTDARGNSTTERRSGYISVSNAIAPHAIPPEGGVIQTADGRIAVTFPKGAVAGEATLNIDGLLPSGVPKAPDGYKVAGTCFSIEAVDAGGKTVTMSSQLVTVTVKYSDEDVAAAGGKPEKLVLARYNSATGKWTILETTLNKADRSLSADTTHFSTWAVMAGKPSGGMTSWIWIILGIAAGLAVAALIVRAVAVERTGKAPVTPG